MEQRIDTTVERLEELSPRLLAPGHCTGWRGKQALAQQFGDNRYTPSLSGTTYNLRRDPTGPSSATTQDSGAYIH